MMAFFSRGKRAPQPVDPSVAATPAEPDESVETTPIEPAAAEQAKAPAAEQAETPSVEAAEAASTPKVPDAAAEASVPISVPSFRGPNAAPPPRRPAPETAPVPKQSVSGLRDNVVVVAALARITGAPTTADLVDVGRQLMQGHLFLRVKGDARSLLSQGRPVPFALATVGRSATSSPTRAAAPCRRASAKTATPTPRRWASPCSRCCGPCCGTP